MSADTLSFGQRGVGSSTSASVIVSNCGTDAFSFTDVRLDAATKPAWHVDTTCATSRTLLRGESCTVDVRFEPTAPGQASGALWLHNTTSTPDQLLTFYGRAIDAQAGTAALRFEPAPADFGVVQLGQESPALVVTLRNVGAAPLVPSALVLNGANPYDFRGTSGASDCGVGRAIAPGAGCTLSLFFGPREPGLRQATLVVDAPQLGSLGFLPLVGQGIEAPAVPATIDIVEFHNARDGQYFITGDPREIALLESAALGSDWSRTGASFKAWPSSATALDALPVCRFFGAPGVGPNSHFYTAYANECEIVRHDPNWIEEGATFYARLPVQGRCKTGDVTVLRLWRAGDTVTASRHRYVVEPSLADQMQAAGFVLEGPVFCAPQ